MKTAGPMTVAVALLVIVFGTANLAVGQDCFDDPDLCAGPRTWKEDFDQDPLDVSPDDWQQRGGGALPTYENGKAILDGSIAAWTLIDSADHFFQGETTVHIVMDANPATGPDNGAGWWINADNEGMQGGFYAINGVLAQNEDDEQEYRFGPAWANVNEVIPVAEGGVDVNVQLVPNEDDLEMNVFYSITDAQETHTGEFPIYPAQGEGTVSNDKWLTLFANASGQGIVDSIEVVNQPELIVEDQLQAGDADMDLDFDQLDLVKVQVAAKYLTGQAATWGEGDWNGAPGGSPGNPPPGNGLFDQLDIISALSAGKYLTGPYAAITHGRHPRRRADVDRLPRRHG